jgi:UDP-N-acetylglucosamine 2-epimerase (non-hydrolysing)
MIHVFIGTKAQLIKMAPIMRELQNRNIEYNFIFSGQHQNTIDALRQNFGLKDPDVILYSGKDIVGIMQMGIWMVRIIIKGLIRKKYVWRGDKNGIVLNHGDTFSTLIGSLLARICGHKNAHIESGLRSFNLFHPFPEELTRVIVFKLSQYYFCPNQWAHDNLKKYSGEKIITGGNTLYDSLVFIKRNQNNLDVNVPVDSYVVASFHRFENIFNENSLKKIISVVENVSCKFKVLIIGHEPTIKKLKEYLLMDKIIQNKNIELRPRYDYANFIRLVSSAEFVMTDGGSNQEECFYLGKPCLIMRKATERTEGLGENVVLSEYKDSVVDQFVDNYKDFSFTEKFLNPSPTEIIVNKLVSLSS